MQINIQTINIESKNIVFGDSPSLKSTPQMLKT